jgi:LysM repeat protein
VQAGENLYRIALRYGLTYQELAAANGITNPNLIAAGTVLTIPGCGGAQPAPTSVAGTGAVAPQPGDTVDANGDILHTVQAGENLFRIALRYGLTYQELAAYNGIANPSEISVGQVIRIPAR